MFYKKIYLLSLVLLILLAVFFYKKLGINNEDLVFYCDLSSNDCSFLINDKNISIKSSAKPILPMNEFQIFIENLGDYKDLKAKLFGLNMYMGDILLKFEKIGENLYKSDVVISSCPLDIMRYRLSLLEGERALNLAFDFEVKR